MEILSLSLCNGLGCLSENKSVALRQPEQQHQVYFGTLPMDQLLGRASTLSIQPIYLCLFRPVLQNTLVQNKSSPLSHPTERPGGAG